MVDALLCGLLPCLVLAIMLLLFLLERRWEEERAAGNVSKRRRGREGATQQGQPGAEQPRGDDWEGRRVGDFVLGRGIIAKGLYGHVREGYHVATGTKVAVKVVEKARVPGRQYEEIALMRRTSHRNLVQLLDVIETKDTAFLVLEFLGGGELFHYMHDKHRLSEDEARRCWRQIVCAVAYLHCSGIAHRDLKLENVMFATPGGRKVKVIDLGLSCSVWPGRLLTSYCGSVEYAAPEVLLRQPHDGRGVDVWALGVILYTLVVGFRPFLDRKAALQGDYISLDEVAQSPDGVDTTPEFRDLLQQIFQMDPRQRISIHGIMAHPWTGF
ncbi:protein kinase domain containing protein [Acanthamoeba castellanii str. Neff]|uniref:non-specific serine/threonine protein kinase n=1 Tax=Acanthamoeba castellanii (strain ATCC 30010 / Neff) TaxID=1257118 RepID=L8H4S9_ACACF|nr:protein kinase domain containing protein [Acanthamoeba castellanii str. Neff]ELR19738.1 protein kinase domain containing protein [Acanthamoeba castellanii str. Neff]